VRFLLLGKGNLGSNIYKYLKKNNYFFDCLTRKNFDLVKNFDYLELYIKKKKYDYIINSIGISKFSECEKNLNNARKVNAYFPIKLYHLSKKIGFFLIHFSTEAVFSGKKNNIPSELDRPNPTTAYGKTKYIADKYLIGKKNVLVIRLPLLIGPGQDNQVVNKLIKKLKKNETIYVSKDVMTTPLITIIFIKFFFKKILKSYLMDKKILHVTSFKLLSTYQIILIFSEILRSQSKIIPVKEIFFNNDFIKPKNLGIDTIHKECKLNFSKFELKKIKW